jgi:hypothetical protein
MHKILRKFADRLPLQFRVLYRQFLLRIVDFEALSVEADVVGFLGQFAGIAIMLSLIHAFIAYIYMGMYRSGALRLAFAWHMEQYLIATTMLLVGLVAIVSWDATFPDRRDLMVLSPLPVRSSTILFAKLAATGAIIALVITTLNAAASLTWSMALGYPVAGYPGALRCFAAYWFTMTAAGLFLYASVLTVQGVIALLLPRRLFLRLSGLLQLAAFALFIVVYFLQGVLTSPTALAAPENQRLLAWSPSFWFFALFNQLGGSTIPVPAWLAMRAWVGLGIAVAGAVASLLLSYLRTMRKTVEEPDLVPAARGSNWALPFGSGLQTAILQFSVRSLARSRQHRVVLAFYLGVGMAISLLCMRHEAPLSAFPRPLSSGFLTATFAMMSFAVIGLRSVYALPVSLTANWVLRTTQLAPPERYIASARRSLLLLAVLPVWIASALFALAYRPLGQAAAHLAILGLLGFILADLNLLGFYKVPFTCSYLPGKSNIQLGFWAFILVFVPLALLGATRELRILSHPFQYACIVFSLAVIAAGLWVLNYKRSKSAVLYFEELPEEVITTLRLISVPSPAATPSRHS